jgi:hypothetical protein
MSGELEACVKCASPLFYEDEKVLIRDTGEVKYVSTREQGHLISVYCVPCATAVFDAVAEDNLTSQS